MNPYKFLYIVGCFVSLGFMLGVMEEDISPSTLVLLCLFFWFLSWAGVIALIIRSVNYLLKREGRSVNRKDEPLSG